MSLIKRVVFKTQDHDNQETAIAVHHSAVVLKLFQQI